MRDSFARKLPYFQFFQFFNFFSEVEDIQESFSVDSELVMSKLLSRRPAFSLAESA